MVNLVLNVRLYCTPVFTRGQELSVFVPSNVCVRSKHLSLSSYWRQRPRQLGFQSSEHVERAC